MLQTLYESARYVMRTNGFSQILMGVVVALLVGSAEAGPVLQNVTQSAGISYVANSTDSTPMGGMAGGAGSRDCIAARHLQSPVV